MALSSPTPLSAHARILSADAEAVAACADRLREIAALLRGQAVTPGWLYELLNAQISACTVAAADLADAAARLHDLADGG